MKTESLDFHLPAELIATKPLQRRETARLLVLRLAQKEMSHATINDLPDLLCAGDLLVRNQSRVLPARLIGRRGKHDSRGGGRVEGLYLKTASDGRWRVLLSASGRLQLGESLRLEGPNGNSMNIELVERDQEGWWVQPETSQPAALALDCIGHTPLPPYILRARASRHEHVDDQDDRIWYQTQFASSTDAGSVAAPTAGLHLTHDVLKRCAQSGIDHASITLHVGEGTFRPVSTARLEDHPMHSESWSVDAAGAARLAQGPMSGGRVVAVGTTTVRTLESLPVDFDGQPIAGATELMISPPYRFRWVDALLTNFHLPRSTLIALVAAMAGLEFTLDAYRYAIESGYRFYSYGDAMLILPE